MSAGEENHVDETTYVSMFSGVGVLDLGLRCALPEARCIGYVERDIHAAEILACRIDEGSLDDAPVWSDVRTFPGQLYRGRVAGIVAGFPCPDYSVAGKRAGIVGKHGQLWDYLAITIRDVGPDWVLLENVPGILAGHPGSGSERGNRETFLPAGLWFVLGDLADIGYDAEWLCLRASEVGASHRRNRWFCLAYRQRARRATRGYGDQRATGAEGDSELADAASIGRERTPDIGELEGSRRSERSFEIFAPGPSWPGWPDMLVRHPELRPAISQAEAEHLVRGLADGLAETLAGSRTDQLRATGNGVVPLQAAVAFVELARRAGLIL